MEEHIVLCEHADIKCPWCDTDTTPHGLSAHAETECKTHFETVASHSTHPLQIYLYMLYPMLLVIVCTDLVN